MVRKVIISLIISLSVLSVLAQKTQGNRAFKPGEVMEYDAYFNLGPIWIKLGYAKFTVEKDSVGYKFTVSAQNLPKWDRIYSLNTVHTATSTLNLEPVTYHAVTTENGKHSELLYIYDYKNLLVDRRMVTEKYPDGSYKVFHMQSYSQDIINSIYVARNVDLTQNKGKDIPFYPIYDDKVIPVYGSVVGKESVKTRNGEKYDCIKCMTYPPEGTLFDAKEPVYIWITDDSREIPILVEAKIMIGRVKVYLSSYKEGK